ncbi:methyl-accepting chemotaxis protein [Paracidobacterium acidisoli]|nr:methyl-accepting chemotaxis protein [Paracidobacterium acidisoli]MBT9332870.1 methyl-accepting chemotaxis protein [Paracidobacterium acidisoli]
MTAMVNLRLAHKLRISTAVLMLFVLMGSLAAYWKIRQASELSVDLSTRQLPAMLAMRDLRLHAVESSTALKSYLLFGVDPAMAARYRGQFDRAQQEGLTSVQAIESARSSLARNVDMTRLDAMLSEYHIYEEKQKTVAQMAFGQGSDSTGKAFDLLQGETAQHYDRLSSLMTTVLDQQVAASGHSLEETVHLSHLEAIYMWLATFAGGLLGLLLSEVTIRRIVRSIVMVADRAQSIAEGDLMSEALSLDSNDEVTGLARSVNQMQQNLREMIGTMGEIAATVNQDALELTRSAADSSRRTKEQSLQTQQAAAAMQEMSISIAEVSRHAQNSAANARQAAATAREGGSIVDQMLVSMQSIADSVRNTADTVQRLGRESEQIIRIVNVIEEIAQKTNLLALNAAIEAARAGEQGRGFAVVAGEVRRLAESTRNATSEIAQMIQGIQGHTRGAVQAMETGTATVSEGVETTRRAGESLARIIQASDQVDSMIAQIATAATQQAEAARQSSENVDVINRLGEESAAAIPAMNTIVHSVESGAQRLQQHIGKFRIEESRAILRPGLSVHPGPQPVPAYGD